MILSVFAVSGQAFAEDYVSAADSRSMLKNINSFRRGSDAWYWNSNDTRKIKQIGLKKLKYDENLEKIAKIRAKEIQKKFAHTRPNGKDWFTCTTTDAEGNVVKTYGENIAAGTDVDAARAFELWREDDEPYAGQGHRRNMLFEDFTCIGIAGFVADNGWTYWVQEFGYHLSAQTQSSEDGEASESESSVTKPAATKIKKVTPLKKSFKLTWKRVTKNSNGYEIQYALNKKFTKSKKTVTVKKNKITKKTVKKLKANKKYFVRIRAYRVVNGTKYYSKWSKIKTVKVKG